MGRRTSILPALALAACLTAGSGWPAMGVDAQSSLPPIPAIAPATSDLTPLAIDEPGLQAGVASRDLSPTNDDLTGCSLFLGGYGVGNTRGCATGVHDAIEARALAVAHEGEAIVVITLDLPGMGNKQMSAIRNGVAAETGIPAANVIVHVTHTHGGPDFQGLWGGVPAAYRQRVVDETIGAGVEAVRELVPVNATAGSVQVPNLHSNRRDWPIRDDALSVVQLRRVDDDQVVSTLVNYAAHPTVLGAVRLAHTDYVGPLRNAVDTSQGGLTLYVNGAQGDLSPSAPSDPDPYVRAAMLGEAIAAQVDVALADAAPVPEGLQIVSNPITFAVENAFFLTVLDPEAAEFVALLGITMVDYYDFNDLGGGRYTVDSLMTAFALGDGDRSVHAVTMPGEALSRLAVDLREALGGDEQLLLGTSSDSLGYQIPEDEWQTGRNGNYEESVSIERQAGTKVLDTTRQLADRLRPAADAAFTDVPAGSFFEDGVAWLVRERITTGFGGSSSTFAPNVVVSRGQMAAFLWRMMDRAPVTTPHGFSDVPAGVFFDDAVKWLKDRRITTGFGGSTTVFNPGAPVTRGQVAAFLWRTAGEPAVSTPHGFSDVPAGAYFDEAVKWMRVHGITTGFGGSTTVFNPGAPVTRGQVAAFLHRLASTPEAWANEAPLTAEFRCELLDLSSCLLPWPSNFHTRPDATTDTGRRLDFRRQSMPANKDGVRIDPLDSNRNDGFSPGSSVIFYVPGLDLAQTGAAPITDIERSLDADAPVLIMDAETGERWPLWVEKDLQTPPNTPAVQVTIARPAKNFLEGRRYIVVLRNMKTVDGATIPAPRAFAAYRDGTLTDVPAIEARRARMNALLDRVEDLGVPRDDLYLAWDFTVASERNLSERMLHIRDDALGQLGGQSPTFTIPDATCSPGQTNVGVACGVEPTPDDPYLVRKVFGTVRVPNYLNVNSTVGGLSPLPRFNWGPDGLPVQNPEHPTIDVLFQCNIPRSTTSAEPARVGLYGHGLLGAFTELGAGNMRQLGDEHNMVFCATYWKGMSGPDLVNTFQILNDMSKFHGLADAAQQGFLNFIFLGRALLHEDGFASHPAFQDEGGSLLDGSELFYDGNSQGGIMGGALAAVSPDIKRAVLGVPGMNYSTMLRRSSNWSTYQAVFNPAYPNAFERPIILAIVQLQWDRAETNGYAHHITKDPYPGTPATQVLMHVAWADWQVAQVSADVMARTIGAAVRLPAVPDGRNPDVKPYWGIDVIDSFPYDGSAMIIWDSGNPAPFTDYRPPRDAIGDPHGKPRNQTNARVQKSEFLRPGGLVVEVCGGLVCLAP